MSAKIVQVEAKVVLTEGSCGAVESLDDLVRLDLGDCTCKGIAKDIDGCGVGAAGVQANALYQSGPSLDGAQDLVGITGPLSDGVILNVVFSVTRR